MTEVFCTITVKMLLGQTAIVRAALPGPGKEETASQDERMSYSGSRVGGGDVNSGDWAEGQDS